MPQDMLSMRKNGKVLQIKWECKLSNQVIARTFIITHCTVNEYLRRAEQAGLTWPLPETSSEDAL